MRDELLDDLRHELRTPINHIVGYAELLLEQAADLQRPELVPDLQRIHSAGKQLLKPIADHLDAAHVHLTAADLDHLSLELRTPLTTIIGYAELLADGAETDLPDGFLTDVRRIRDAGTQLLGLVNATLGVLATHPTSTGAVRTETFPAVAEPTPSGTVSGHLLVVDDNAANRDILSRRLIRLGYTVSCAENGRVAVERLQRGDVDLVLLDVMMPEMDGFDVLARRRHDAQLSEVPIIVLSAQDELESAVRCIELGADDYLLKPYESVLLRARIGASLERKQLRDREKEYVRLLAWERERSERLLLNMLPEPIAARLKDAHSIIADTLAEVSVLFADLVGFTQLSVRVSPQAMVGMLNRIFSAFDELAEQHGLEKIKTIGDGYEVIAGAPLPRQDHAEAVAEMALGMQAVIRALSQESGWPLNIRIGIDSGGPVVAGVIGQKKYVYEVWGDCVNTASRMESHGLAGCIQVTAAAYERLRGRYAFTERGAIEVKSIGTMSTYLLMGRRAFQ